ncbi:MAG: 2OG-Fe(II) oxygenase [Sphingomonas sp.]|nr:2OG-Fe(II) oxygenase [Sphingomonas sp.]
MNVLDEANKLVAAGQQQAALGLVLGAAERGDPEAMFAIANWRIFGIHGQRDPAEAHRLLDTARALGHVEAAGLKATLIGNGTGCGSGSDPEAAAQMLEAIRPHSEHANVQLTLSARMPPEQDALKLPHEQLSDAPLIRAVRGLFTVDECNYLIALAQPHLQRSYVFDPLTGRQMPHPIRTSSGMNFGPTLEDRVVHFLNRRLATATGTAVEAGEPLHMLCYAPGEEYKPHHDAVPGGGNQRLWTVLVYLNDGYSGGATRFSLIDVEFRGGVGDALIFRNADAAGNGDPATLHAGLPVTGGVKWLATRWIRARSYDPFIGQ